MAADTAHPALSVEKLFAEREARRAREQGAEAQLHEKEQKQLAEFKKRLDTFQVTDEQRQIAMDRIRRAFDRGETELMLVSFPSSFCTDGGRAINNTDVPPINKPDDAARAAHPEPEWLATLPGGVREVYKAWHQYFRPGGFGFSARIINYPGGKPGDVGLFFSWPKSSADAGAKLHT
ncbi:MAG: hypothetical protein JO110_05560 [Acetobacteraceae bacterium]|nr:hypothetical protein [Acetobacteraceae bacterium]